MGGGRLGATGRCVFAMKVTDKISFNDYWNNTLYFDKKPVRNGSRKMMVGDNIYYQQPSGAWNQADSHHSQADGSLNPHNLRTDTQSSRVLISRHFFYFGCNAPEIPADLLNKIGYQNGRNYRKFSAHECTEIIGWLYRSYANHLNRIMGDPYDFNQSEKRYSAGDNKLT
jgi:hypothetical protein